jgi:hypothetical protein
MICVGTVEKLIPSWASFSIPIVSERRFLELVGKPASDNDQKTYSADQLVP